MDETTIRDHAQAHADAVVSGDMDALTQDFARPSSQSGLPVRPATVTGAG